MHTLILEHTLQGRQNWMEISRQKDHRLKEASKVYSLKASRRERRVASSSLRDRVLLLKFELRASLWCAYDTPQCREPLEEKSDDEQKETIHCQRKRSIGRRLTPSPALHRTQFGTKHEEQSGRPRALLDIIVERIFGALPERP
jgi:hypothetical protein